MHEPIAQVSRSRPTGVSVIATLAWIYGGLIIVVALLGFLGLGIAGHHIPGVLDALAITLLVVTLIIGVAALVVGWGLWTLKRWAFWATAIVVIIGIVDHLIGLITRQTATVSSILDLIIAVIVLAYLFGDPNVREAFRIR
ncbi:hypothetical protein ccbrp13_19370 [Ktedonobacteria bacterium brp13]|nr:hypothetical protein ccbrp13_19370 [Ktedonobacteria bacterium brp13]